MRLRRSAALRGGLYVRHSLKNANDVHGFFAIVIGLLSWLFAAAQLTLLAAEVSVAFTPEADRAAPWRRTPRTCRRKLAGNRPIGLKSCTQSAELHGCNLLPVR